jgi:hypothetical protein
VAATRARDLLVVGAVGDGPWEGGWVSPLNAALYPADAARRQPRPMRGCPSFTSKDTVRRRPDGDPAGMSTVAPGCHTLTGVSGDYDVVWWSPEPQVLALDAEPLFGLRREDLVVKDVPPSIIQRYVDEHRAWRAERSRAIGAASTPAHAVRIASEAAADDSLELDGPEVTVERLETPGERPQGQRFGALVHAVLADVPLTSPATATLAGDGDLQAIAAVHGRLLGATADEVAAAGHLAGVVLRHPLLRAAAAADARGECYRETPVTRRLPSGTIVEGTVDLAWQQDGEFVIVDFKTDQHVGESIDSYRRQVQLYAAAIAEATGRPARGVVLRV